MPFTKENCEFVLIEAFNAMYPELVKTSATRGQKINQVVKKCLTNPTLNLSNVELQQLVAIADDLIYNKSKVTRQNCTNPYSFPLSEFIDESMLMLPAELRKSNIINRNNSITRMFEYMCDRRTASGLFITGSIAMAAFFMLRTTQDKEPQARYQKLKIL